MRSFLKCLVPALALALSGCTDGAANRRPIEQAVGGDCVFTQGYWKNHEEAWPVDELTLGDVTYSQDELLAIFDTPVEGNGLISLAHQLIAAKLNVASGAPDGEISDAIDDADDLIGDLVVPPIGDGYLDPSVTSALVGELDGFNNDGPSSCEEEPEPFCGDGTMDDGEDCDDGNDLDGDGCSSDCMVEETPSCGDGTMDAGEECDDGNNVDGDGCSKSCETEETPPVCGDGTMDDGEECDDGNNLDGDGCASDCTIETPPPPPAECGNGVVEAGEECDDGNDDDLDACNNNCNAVTG